VFIGVDVRDVDSEEGVREVVAGGEGWVGEVGVDYEDGDEGEDEAEAEAVEAKVGV